MNVDLPDRLTDTLAITGAATGTHTIIFNNTNPLTPLSDPTRTYALKVITYATGNPLFTSNTIDSGMFTYQLYKGDGGLIMPDPNAYYLSAGDTLSRAADAILITAGVMGTDWHYDLDTVTKRLGDLRFGSGGTGDSPVGSSGTGVSPVSPHTTNLWLRANTYRLSASPTLAGSSFKQDTYAITAGADYTLNAVAATTSLGAFIAMGRTTRTFDDTRNAYGDGSTNTAGAGAYFLYTNDTGIFADTVLRYDRYRNTLNTRAIDGYLARGAYTNHILGLSEELGWRLTRGAWWLEPTLQAAAAWINTADYPLTHEATAATLNVHVASSAAMQYRLQVRSGATLGRISPYIKFAEVRSSTTGGEVTAQSRPFAPNFDGWRTELGLGATYLLNSKNQLYFDYDYARTPAYERPWSLTLGYRRTW